MRRKKVDSSTAKVAETPGSLSVKEAGAKGGRRTLELHGKRFLRQIGAKGGQRTAELYAELLSEFGKKGGRPKRPTLDGSVGGAR